MSVLPEGWVQSTVGEVCSIQLGRQRSPKNHQGPHMRPYLRSANVTWRGIDVSDVKEMNFDPTEVPTFELAAGDILLNEASGSPGEVGKPAVWRGEVPGACFQNTLLRVRSKELDERFLYWHFYGAAFSGRFGEAGRGVNIRHLGKRGLETFPLPVPPLPEQRRIVAAIDEHFSRLDAAEAYLEAALRRLAALREVATARLFSSEEWGWTTLGEIADVRGGVTKDSKRQDDPDFVEVPFLRVANVQRGYLNLSEMKTIRVPRVKAEALALEVGDVLFNEGGDRDKLGRGWVWDGQVDDCIHQNHVFRARLLSDDFDPRFVSTHGNTWGKRWFERNGKQTTNLASLNLTTLKRFPVPAAPMAEQQEIVGKLRRLEADTGRAEQDVTIARRRGAALRRSVLAAAFSGRLVPQDPSGEPASVLLERIAAERSAAKPPSRKRVTA